MPTQQIESKIMEVTPGLAEAWLKKNIRNRPIREAVVRSYTQDMKDDKWASNGEGIKFSWDGDLLDGQHRLTSLIRARVTLPMLVITGLDPKAFDTIDIGARRTPGNVLDVMQIKHSKRTAAVLAIVKYFDTGVSSRSRVRTSIPTNRIASVLAEYPDVPDALEEIGSAKPKVINRALLDALYYLCRRKDPVMAMEFVQALRDGVNVEIVPAWQFLRERLISDITSTERMSDVKVFALAIKAWNSARNGVDVKKLIWSPDREDFPKIA